MSKREQQEAGIAVQLFVMFFVSGLASLVYQTVWIRKFSFALGGAAYSMSVVVSTFMAGLAVGAAVLGRAADKTKRPLVFYAGLEIAIAACALILAWTDGVREQMARALIHTEALEGTLLVRVFIVVVWLGVPCFLIGGTLPVMVRFVVRRLASLGQRVGALYFVNTLGAAAGTLLTGFVLIEWLGLKGASQFAAGLNVLVALAALWLGRRVARAEAAAPPEPPPEPEPVEPHRRLMVMLVPALAFFISGLSSLLLEMSWTRLIMGFLQAGTIVISINLSIMLLGFALGGVAASRAADNTKSPQALAAVLFAATALATLVGLSSVEPLSLSLGGDTNPYYLNSLQLVSVIGILFPASLCMGALFPVLMRVLVVSKDQIGTQLGGFYALNTVGTVIGGVAAPFFMIPRFGTSVTILTAVVMQLTMAGALWAQSFRSAAGVAKWLPLAIGGLAVALIPLNADVYHEALRDAAQSFRPHWSQERAYVEGADSTVVLYEADDIGKQTQGDNNRFRIQVNASPLVAFDTNETKLMAHLPLLAVPNPKRALVICFGVGNTFRAALAHDIEVDVVDINEAIPQLAKLHQADPSKTFDNPKGRITINDGRNFLLLTDKTYDMITIDPAPPVWMVGMSNIQSLEFYQLMAERLSPQGVVESWMLAGHEGDYEATLAAFHQVFPYMAVFRSRRYFAYHVLGSKAPIRFSQARLQKLLTDPRLIEDLGESDITFFTPDLFQNLYVTDESGVETMIAGHAPLTDDRPIIEYRTLRGLKEQQFVFPDSVKKPLVLGP